MLFDTHSHLNFAVFKNDFDEVIKECFKNNIHCIVVGTKYETSKRAIEIAKKYDKGIYTAIGLYPIHLETGLVKIKNDNEEIELKTKEENFDYQKYKDLALSGNKKVVAIGETGLDYYWKPKTTKKKELFKQKQKEILLQQIKLAQELNLPLIFHCRMAHNDLLAVLRDEIKNQKLKIEGVIHSFTGTLEELHKYLDLGLYIGYNGIIFKNIEGINFEELIKNTPLDRILVETDCPYLTPPQFSEKRNNPLAVKLVVEKIAKIKNLSFEKISEITVQNGKNLFRIR